MSVPSNNVLVNCDSPYDISNTAFSQFEPATAYRCRVLLCPEDVGFSAHCLNLLGVISEGDTEKEALDNMGDSFRETLSYYREANRQIPWGGVDVPRPAGSLERWIVVRL